MAKKKDPVYDYMVKRYRFPLVDNSELNFISNGDAETDTKGGQPNSTPWRLVSAMYVPFAEYQFVYYFIREL